MDVYHKVLSRIYELSGGRETEDVDLVELTKADGFFSNIENIKSHLSTEGWVTDSPKKGNVRITHWGVAEVKRGARAGSSSTEPAERQASRLLADAKAFVIEIEEFATDPETKQLKVLEKRLGAIHETMSRIRSLI
jgi:hypothetical protein